MLKKYRFPPSQRPPLKFAALTFLLLLTSCSEIHKKPPSPLSDSWVLFSSGHGWGYYSPAESKFSINPEFGYLGEFASNGLALAEQKNTRLYGFIDTQGKYVIAPTYEWNWQKPAFSDNGLATVKKDGKFGFINSEGEIVIPFYFDSASRFLNNIAIVKKEGNSYLIDSSGNSISEKYDFISDFENGFSAVEKDGLWGHIREDGSVAIPPQYKNVGQFSEEGLAAVLMDSESRWGYMDTKGRLVIPPKFEKADMFANGLASVLQKGLRGFIDTNGNLVIAPEFEKAYPFQSNGLAITVKNGLWGVINSEGKTIVPHQHRYILSFSENGLASFSPDLEKWGFIDTSGNTIIPAKYLTANPFDHSGFAKIELPNKENLWGLIDSDGNLILEGLTICQDLPVWRQIRALKNNKNEVVWPLGTEKDLCTEALQKHLSEDI